MKALVTGGAGFIGSHITQQLCAKGASVIVVDNMSLGDLNNLAWKSAGDDVEFVKGEAGDSELMSKLLQGVDWVFHEGALPSVPRSVKEPVQSNHHNLDTTLNLLVAARDAGVKRFLFASSSSIYGDIEEEYKHEELPPNPLSPYGLQKYGSEKYCQLFYKLYGFETVALRYFNVFGPRQAFDSPYSGVIAKFCTLMLKGESPLIFGDGEQSRDFTFIDNVVSANLLAAEAPAEKVAGEIFNPATGRSISVNKLLADLNGLLGSGIQAQYEPPRTGDIRSSLADISKAKERFNYEVLVTWEEGLAKTLDFYREQA